MNIDISGLMKAHEEDDDYTGDDGLLYCGKCHTPKQKRLSFDPATREQKETLVRAACKCQREADEAADLRAKREKFKQEMACRWEDGVHERELLRYKFSEDDGETLEILRVCKNYVDRWEEMLQNNIGVLFYGSVGRGKSFYASCIANALLEKNVPVVATSFPRLLNILQNATDRQQVIDKLKRYKLLFIDDLGAERDSSYASEQVYNIVQSREICRLPLIVTTNLTQEEMKNPATMRQDQIYDRVLEMCPLRIKMTGENRRRLDAERRKKIAQSLLLE